MKIRMRRLEEEIKEIEKELKMAQGKMEKRKGPNTKEEQRNEKMPRTSDEKHNGLNHIDDLGADDKTEWYWMAAEEEEERTNTEGEAELDIETMYAHMEKISGEDTYENEGNGKQSGGKQSIPLSERTRWADVDVEEEEEEEPKHTCNDIDEEEREEKLVRNLCQ